MYTGPLDETRFYRKDYPIKELEQKLLRVTKMKLVVDFPADPMVKPYGDDRKVSEVMPLSL